MFCWCYTTVMRLSWAQVRWAKCSSAPCDKVYKKIFVSALGPFFDPYSQKICLLGVQKAFANKFFSFGLPQLKVGKSQISDRDCLNFF